MMELKPCPFCGQEVDHFNARVNNGKTSFLEVYCSCGRFEFYGEGKDAVEKWNRRAFAINEGEGYEAYRR